MTPDRQQDPFVALLLFGPCSFGTESRATHTHTHTHTHTVGRLGAADIGCRAGGPKVFGLPVIDPTPIGGLNTGPVAVAAAAAPV